MLRTVLALVIAAHGIGHILFLIPLLGIADWGQSTRSWLFAVMFAFGSVVFGLLGQYGWWRSAAIIAAVISIVGLILFWSTPMTAPAISALEFNLLVLAALLIAHWPSIETIGA